MQEFVNELDLTVLRKSHKQKHDIKFLSFVLEIRCRSFMGITGFFFSKEIPLVGSLECWLFPFLPPIICFWLSLM